MISKPISKYGAGNTGYFPGAEESIIVELNVERKSFQQEKLESGFRKWSVFRLRTRLLRGPRALLIENCWPYITFPVFQYAFPVRRPLDF
jgi:hypothetical protein